MNYFTFFWWKGQKNLGPPFGIFAGLVGGARQQCVSSDSGLISTVLDSLR
jgi:hypothetical protein